MTHYGPHNRKLTDEQVAKIRELDSEGSLTKKEIAEMFGVSPGHVGNICNFIVHYKPEDE